MTREHDSFFWQLSNNVTQALLHLCPRAFSKIGTTDAHAEQGVACKSGMLLSAIEEARTMGMTRSLQYLQAMLTECNDIAIAQQTA